MLAPVSCISVSSAGRTPDKDCDIVGRSELIKHSTTSELLNLPGTSWRWMSEPASSSGTSRPWTASPFSTSFRPLASISAEESREPSCALCSTVAFHLHKEGDSKVHKSLTITYARILYLEVVAVLHWRHCSSPLPRRQSSSPPPRRRRLVEAELLLSVKACFHRDVLFCSFFSSFEISDKNAGVVCVLLPKLVPDGPSVMGVSC